MMRGFKWELERARTDSLQLADIYQGTEAEEEQVQNLETTMTPIKNSVEGHQGHHSFLRW